MSHFHISQRASSSTDPMNGTAPEADYFARDFVYSNSETAIESHLVHFFFSSSWGEAGCNAETSDSHKSNQYAKRKRKWRFVSCFYPSVSRIAPSEASYTREDNFWFVPLRHFSINRWFYCGKQSHFEIRILIQVKVILSAILISISNGAESMEQKEINWDRCRWTISLKTSGDGEGRVFWCLNRLFHYILLITEHQLWRRCVAGATDIRERDPFCAGINPRAKIELEMNYLISFFLTFPFSSGFKTRVFRISFDNKKFRCRRLKRGARRKRQEKCEKINYFLILFFFGALVSSGRCNSSFRWKWKWVFHSLNCLRFA